MILTLKGEKREFQDGLNLLEIAGQISQEELAGAKESLCSSLLGTHDSPGAIEGYYESGALSGHDQTPQQYIDQVRAVTVEDCARVAKTLRYHSSFFLKGGA